MGFEPIGFVLERVYDLLKYEATILLVDEKTAIEGLQQELELIESYLKDMDEVERLATVNHVLRTKVQHLRQILPQIENLLDTVADQRHLRQIQPSFFEKLKAFFSCASNPLIQKHHLVGEITGIREKLNDIRRPDGYPLPNTNSQVIIYKKKLQSDPDIIDPKFIIGLEDDVSDLVAKFVGKEGERGANSAIVGMGGSGKTTLARQFYNHEEIKKAFPRRAWVCVSQQWNTHDLLLQICAKLGVRLSDDERSIPHDKLTEFLHEDGSCLVVLDDVWERKALQDFSLLIGNGRVLITTRNEGIVQFPEMDPFHIHNMRRLTTEQSRELFSKIVCNNKVVIVKFNEDEKEEDGFAKLGRVMLEKCGGLPIAIITLAGLLGTKNTIQQWESIRDDVISVIMKNERGFLRYEAVKKVLEFSYFDLPYYLKPCFLYLGTFKEDEEIDADTLINLWIDEGFVKPDQCPQRRRLNEVAKNFLEELVQRCMVQVVERDYAGDVSRIQIHDLMRDLCIEKAKELGFFRVFSPSTTSSTQIEPYSRAIIQNHDLNRVESVKLDERLRTLIWINGIYSRDLPKQLFPFEKLKQVRVLSLQWVELGDSAQHIGNMVLLRYLRLWQCRFSTGRMDFPKNLRNLQTFIFGGTFILNDESDVELSDNMFGSMEQLRVLSLSLWGSRRVSRKRPSILMGVDKLRNLQTLDIEADEWIVKELPAISTDLQKLKIQDIDSQPQLDAILCCVNSNTLTRLETLHLSLRSRLLEFDLQKMELERCQHLKSLFLDGKIKKQRLNYEWSFPPNLLSLNLMSTEVEEEDDMNQVIAEVAHLRELNLDENAYKGANLTMSGLPKLQNLFLRKLPGLKEWRITEGSLPQLRELRIWDCRELERIPDGIRNIKTLQLLGVTSMPRRFCKRVSKREEGESDGGEDFHLVQHIPTVTFYNIKD